MIITSLLQSQLVCGYSRASIDPPNAEVIHNIIVIPVYTNDKIPSISIGELLDIFLEAENYFEESSYGRVLFHFDMVGWVKIAGEMESYIDTVEYPNGATRNTTSERIVAEAIHEVDASLDFSIYDGLMVVFSGYGRQDLLGSDGCPANCHLPSIIQVDGKRFIGVPVVSEFASLSTFAHELTHWLGADDLYDYLGRHDSISFWDLMGSGNKTIRIGMCAYTKLNVGFIVGNEILEFTGGSVRFMLSPLTNAHKEYRALRYELPDGRLLMMEARDNTIGFDSNLPSRGLLVYIVNETAVENYDGGVQILLLNETQAVDNAPLRVGEIMHLPDYDIAIRVRAHSSNGLLVDVSSEEELTWLEVKRISLPEESEILMANVENSASLIFANSSGAHSYYLSLLCKDRGWKTVRLYCSPDHGRSWTLLLDSYGKFNVSPSANSLCYYRSSWEDSLKLICEINIGDARIVAVVTYYLSDGQWEYLNLSSMAPEQLYPFLGASCDGSRLFIAAFSTNASTQGISSLLFENSSWSHSWVPTTQFRILLTNCPSGEAPYVLFQNATGLFMYKFGTLDVFMLKSNSTWRSCAAFSDRVYLAYLNVENGHYTFRVSAGYPELGFTDIVIKNISSSPGFPALCVVDSQVDAIDIDEGLMTLHNIDTVSNTELVLPPCRVEGFVVMPCTDQSTRIRPLILSLVGNHVSTLHRAYSPPEEIQELIWFYEATESPSDGMQPGWLVPVIAIAAIVSLVTIVAYYIRKRKAQTGS